MDAAEQYAALEKFDQDLDLAELERQLSEFDLFRLLNVNWRQEEIHSQVLAWLLNPRKNHQLGDAFLRGFLSATTALELSGADLSAARVQREWPNEVDGQRGFLDILILDEEKQFLCAIENKVYSEEHSRQLTRYRRALETDYPDFTRFYLFLSPRGVSAYDVAEREHWRPVDYGVVCQVVEKTVAISAGSISEDVRAFLRQYANCLRRYILGGDADIQKLAATVHRRHKAAIDFINATAPNYYRREVGRIVKEVVQENASVLRWDFVSEDRSQIRFRPKDWQGFRSIQLGTGWMPGSDALALFEFKNNDSRLNLVVVISPTEAIHESTREALDSCLTQIESTPLRRWTWSEWTLFDIGTDILNQSDLEQWDENSIRSRIEAWVSVFAKNEYPHIRDAVIQCFQEFEAAKEP